MKGRVGWALRGALEPTYSTRLQRARKSSSTASSWGSIPVPRCGPLHRPQPNFTACCHWASPAAQPTWRPLWPGSGLPLSPPPCIATPPCTPHLWPPRTPRCAWLTARTLGVSFLQYCSQRSTAGRPLVQVRNSLSAFSQVTLYLLSH